MQFEKQKNNGYKIDLRAMEKLIANNIRKKRVILGISQADVAKAIGISNYQMQKYERNVEKSPSSFLKIITKFLKAPIWKFYN